MTFRLFRRVSALLASLILVFAVAGPAFASVPQGDSYFYCPSRPVYVHVVWHYDASGFAPGSAPWFDYYTGTQTWYANNQQGRIGGGAQWLEGQLNWTTSYDACQ